jgi:translation initiation factor 5B
MPPKKTINRKPDEWETESGETVDPIAAATQATMEETTRKDAEEEGSFGVIAATRKSIKRKNKGKGVNDFLNGEDPPEVESSLLEQDLIIKAPVEATMDEEFSVPEKKGKVKGAANDTAKPESGERGEEEDETGADGKLLSKKEKEKLKKEREKQRKKEQVRMVPG